MTNRPLLQAIGICKRFPGVVALNNADFSLLPGEIHALVGENGAGKSTLIKIITGALAPDAGRIDVSGDARQSLTPHQAQAMGIQAIYQENILVRQISVAENVFIGREPRTKFGLFDWRKAAEDTRRIIDDLELVLNPRAMVENLSVADQQFVKIVKALALEPRILIMDEPTTMFNIMDAAKVLKLVRRIADRGVGVIYISHNLGEVGDISDRITVLRDGEVVRTHVNRPEKADMKDVTEDMIGRSVDMFYNKRSHEVGESVLRVEGLMLKERGPEVSFSLRRGEVLGLAGMVGSGRTEIVRALFGADRRIAGRIYLHGREVQPTTPGQAIGLGLGLITEDRQLTGLMLNRNIIENTTLAGLAKLVSAGVIDLKREYAQTQGLGSELNLRTSSLYKRAGELSGGNQQKVVLAKWLFSEAEILIFDEPTRGIDVNAKAEIYNLMSRLTEAGKSIIMVSSDMVELIAMSDRVLVVRNGGIAGELTGDAISEKNIITSALGNGG